MGMIRDTGSHESVWVGRYWLKDRNREGIPFSIWFTVKDGRLHGSTLEPNRFALISDEQLDANIRGHVNEQELVFLKSYRAFEHEPVLFECELSDDGNTATGQWYFGWPHEWTGPFEMKRSTIAAKEDAGKVNPSFTP